MTPSDQEALYKKVVLRFPRWSARRCSGYVHGVADEARYTRPSQSQIRLFAKCRDYANGYVRGFITARGPDAFADPSLKGKRHLIREVGFEYGWWKE